MATDEAIEIDGEAAPAHESPSGGWGLGVPMRLPRNSAHSKNPPWATASSNVARSTNR